MSKLTDITGGGYKSRGFINYWKETILGIIGFFILFVWPAKILQSIYHFSNDFAVVVSIMIVTIFILLLCCISKNKHCK